MFRSKQELYNELISYVKNEYASRPDSKQDIYVKWCEHCKQHINLWSYWQGSLNAKIMLIGQDWGSFDPKNRLLDKQLLKNFKKMDLGEQVNYFDDIDEKVITPTDKNIIKLFSEFGTGYKDIKRRNENLFFTNLCLGYRNKDYSKNFKDKWLQNDLKYLIGFDEITERDTKHISGMLEIIMPDVVICLGKKVYEIIINELSCTKVNLNNFYELLDNHKNFTNILYNGKTITFFAVSHPGGMGSANRKAHCTIKTDKSGFELMADDWHKIGMFIRNKI